MTDYYIPIPPFGVETISGVSGDITLIAGTGMTITPNVGDQTITFASSGGGGVTTLAAIGSSPNANAATISGSTLNLQPASASFGGVITTGTQTLAGAKTWSGGATFSSTIAANDHITVASGKQIRTASGSAGSPAYTYSSDTSTGMFFNGGSNVSWAVAGGLKASVTTSGLKVDNILTLGTGALDFTCSSTASANSFEFKAPSSVNYGVTGGYNFLKISPNMTSNAGDTSFTGVSIAATMAESGGTVPNAIALRVSLDGAGSFGVQPLLQSWVTDGVEQANLSTVGVFTTNSVTAGTIRALNTFQFDAGASSGYVLTSDGSGFGSWQPPSGGAYTFNYPLSESGGVVSLNVQAPLSFGSDLYMAQAGSGADGYLSGTDWNMFNAKIDAGYAAANPSDWASSPPSTIYQALDRLAACLAILNGGPVP